MALNLFGIRDPSGLVMPTYFASKDLAKAQRDRLNTEKAGHVVVYGPDHRKAHTSK